MPRDSWVKMSQVRTLSGERLGAEIGYVNEGDLQEIISGLQQLIE